MARKTSSSFYMRRHSYQYKTYRQDPSTRATFILGQDSWQIYINIMPRTDATINGRLIYISKHTKSITTNRDIGDKHKITDPIQELHNVKTDIGIATVEETH